MRVFWFYLLLLCCGLANTAHSATGKVIKVLPHFLDLQGRHTLSPSLYERDAYQLRLREHPAERSGIRYDVQWKTKGGIFDPLKLQLELRGLSGGDSPKSLTIEKSIGRQGWLSQWAGLELSGAAYKEFGEVTAWRVTLW